MTRNQNGRNDLRRRPGKKNKKLKRANTPPGGNEFRAERRSKGERKKKNDHSSCSSIVSVACRAFNFIFTAMQSYRRERIPSPERDAFRSKSFCGVVNVNFTVESNVFKRHPYISIAASSTAHSSALFPLDPLPIKCWCVLEKSTSAAHFACDCVYAMCCVHSTKGLYYVCCVCSFMECLALHFAFSPHQSRGKGERVK